MEPPPLYETFQFIVKYMSAIPHQLHILSRNKFNRKIKNSSGWHICICLPVLLWIIYKHTYDYMIGYMTNQSLYLSWFVFYTSNDYPGIHEQFTHLFKLCRCLFLFFQTLHSRYAGPCTTGSGWEDKTPARLQIYRFFYSLQLSINSSLVIVH